MPGHKRKVLGIPLEPTSSTSGTAPRSQIAKFSPLISHWLLEAFVCVLVHGAHRHHYVNPCRAAVDASLSAYGILYTRRSHKEYSNTPQHKGRQQSTGDALTLFAILREALPHEQKPPNSSPGCTLCKFFEVGMKNEYLIS